MIFVQTYFDSNSTNSYLSKILSCKSISFKSIRKRLAAAFTLIFVLSAFSTASAIEPQQQAQVKKIIDAFKSNDRVTLSNTVSYPLFRQAPLAPINNQKEFLERYDEVFDRYLLNTIITSNINANWDSIGWRGVILDNGIVALDPDGKITEINHHSQREQAIVNQLTSNRVAKGRRAIHRSVNDFDQAVFELVTNRHRIRVDKISNGELRYTSWPIDKSLSDKPDLILSNGRVIGASGRNQRFIFDNGTYSYQINISHSATNGTPKGSLEVFKDGKEWVRESAVSVNRG